MIDPFSTICTAYDRYCVISSAKDSEEIIKNPDRKRSINNKIFNGIIVVLEKRKLTALIPSIFSFFCPAVGSFVAFDTQIPRPIRIVVAEHKINHYRALIYPPFAEKESKKVHIPFAIERLKKQEELLERFAKGVEQSEVIRTLWAIIVPMHYLSGEQLIQSAECANPAAMKPGLGERCKMGIIRKVERFLTRGAVAFITFLFLFFVPFFSLFSTWVSPKESNLRTIMKASLFVVIYLPIAYLLHFRAFHFSQSVGNIVANQASPLTRKVQQYEEERVNKAMEVLEQCWIH